MVPSDCRSTAGSGSSQSSGRVRGLMRTRTPHDLLQGELLAPLAKGPPPWTAATHYPGNRTWAVVGGMWGSCMCPGTRAIWEDVCSRHCGLHPVLQGLGVRTCQRTPSFRPQVCSGSGRWGGHLACLLLAPAPPRPPVHTGWGLPVPRSPAQHPGFHPSWDPAPQRHQLTLALNDGEVGLP